MTESELDEIEARANAAFRAPWTYSDFLIACEHEFDDEVDDCPTCHGEGEAEIIRVDSPNEYPDGQVIAEIPGLERFSERNGAFIAHARTDVPKLVAEVRRLRGLLYDVKDHCFHIQECIWCDKGTDFNHTNECQAFTPDGEVK